MNTGQGEGGKMALKEVVQLDIYMRGDDLKSYNT